MKINPNYIVDEHNHRIAAQLDIKTFEKIEEIFENHALYRLVQGEDYDDETLDLDSAKEYYEMLEKQK
jgi:hypothetical protein